MERTKTNNNKKFIRNNHNHTSNHDQIVSSSNDKNHNLYSMDSKKPKKKISKSRNPDGRTSKLEKNPRIQDRLVEAISLGNYYEPACAYAGINYSTFREWMLKGEKHRHEGKTSSFTEFCRAVKNAEALAEANLVKEWQSHCPGDWKAIATFMERRYPDRWGRRQAVELTGKGGEPLELQRQYHIVQQVINDPEKRENVAEQFRQRAQLPRLGQPE